MDFSAFHTSLFVVRSTCSVSLCTATCSRMLCQVVSRFHGVDGARRSQHKRWVTRRRACRHAARLVRLDPERNGYTANYTVALFVDANTDTSCTKPCLGCIRQWSGTPGLVQALPCLCIHAFFLRFFSSSSSCSCSCSSVLPWFGALLTCGVVRTQPVGSGDLTV